jgi:hypothetical protein
MRSPLQVSVLALCIALLEPACQGDPGGSSTTDGGSTNGGGTDGGSTDGGSTSGSVDTGGAVPHEVCDRYLTCVAAVAPGSLPAAQMGFGEGGTCWQGSESESQLCLDACEAGLKMYNEISPEEEKCVLCKEHSECDTAAGELCHLGHCEVTTCGDGIVDVKEICDSQPDCASDCQHPFYCNPISGYGCADYTCTIYRKYGSSSVTRPQCLAQTNLQEKAPCGEVLPDLCAPGMACASPTLVSDCEPNGLDGCCTRLCDLGAPAQCKGSETCVPFQDPNDLQLPPEFGYIGFCVLT